jgi:hypothetical protein
VEQGGGTKGTRPSRFVPPAEGQKTQQYQGFFDLLEQVEQLEQGFFKIANKAVKRGILYVYSLYMYFIGNYVPLVPFVPP